MLQKRLPLRDSINPKQKIHHSISNNENYQEQYFDKNSYSDENDQEQLYKNYNLSNFRNDHSVKSSYH